MTHRDRRDMVGAKSVNESPANPVVPRATPRQEGVDEIRIPGKLAYRESARLAREGLEIDRRIHDALIALAEGKRGA
jgi:LDH2 family malate/lactate/ureidoglycolate dehydrogenase